MNVQITKPDRPRGQTFITLWICLLAFSSMQCSRDDATRNSSTLTILIPSDEWILSPDVRWHDGLPVTAHDIKFTFDLFNHPDVRTSTSNTGFHQIESIEVLDGYSFRMTYKPGSIWHSYWHPGYWNIFYPKHQIWNHWV